MNLGTAAATLFMFFASLASAMATEAPPPGALNPDVTQATIQQTICRPGWTATIRPTTSYTDAVKRRMIRERGLRGPASAYELDHFIPLELGGHPSDETNLWPQRWIGPRGAHAKDAAENRLHRAVCAGQIRLDEARQRIRDPHEWHP